MSNTSLTFRFLRFIGLNYSEEEYGHINVIHVVKKIINNTYMSLLQNMMNWFVFEPIAPRMFRPFLLRRMGAKVGKNVFIGDHCKFDLNHSDFLILEDHVHIAGGTRILCHQRNLSGYCVGDDYAKLGYTIDYVHIKKGSLVGMESLILPGVTIGEGAIVGAGSLVSKDIPAWTISTGRPARVIKNIPQRN